LTARLGDTFGLKENIMITVYDNYGIPHQVTMSEFIALEAAELARLMACASADPSQ
jgi:hypothetical protein